MGDRAGAGAGRGEECIARSCATVRGVHAHGEECMRMRTFMRNCKASMSSIGTSESPAPSSARPRAVSVWPSVCTLASDEPAPPRAEPAASVVLPPSSVSERNDVTGEGMSASPKLATVGSWSMTRGGGGSPPPRSWLLMAYSSVRASRSCAERILSLHFTL